MKDDKLILQSFQILQSTRIQIFSSLPEKYGTKLTTMEFHSSEKDKTQFQCNRMLSIVHKN